MYFAVYVGVSVAVCCNLEDDWSAIDGVYFSMATMSTVGYGDFSPSPGGARLFAIAMIFIGVGVVFPLCGAAVNMLLTPLTQKCRALVDRIMPPDFIDIDGDDTRDYPVPHGPIRFYAQTLLPSVLLIVAVQLASAATFAELEGWPFSDAFYHCIVTVTTVGYGDMSIATQSGRMFASFHMLVGVCLFAEVLVTIDVARAERFLAQQRLTAVRTELTPELFRRLITQAMRMRPDDDDPAALSETEFVLALMAEYGFVDLLTLEPLFKLYRKLDVDPDGRLSVEDVEKTQRLNPAELRKLRRQNTMSAAERQGLKEEARRNLRSSRLKGKCLASLCSARVGAHSAGKELTQVLPFAASPEPLAAIDLPDRPHICACHSACPEVCDAT